MSSLAIGAAIEVAEAGREEEQRSSGGGGGSFVGDIQLLPSMSEIKASSLAMDWLHLVPRHLLMARGGRIWTEQVRASP